MISGENQWQALREALLSAYARLGQTMGDIHKKQVKLIVGIASVAILIAIGTLLPEALALGRDRMILGQVTSEPLDAGEMSDYVNISMVDKVSLLGQAEGASFLPLKTGAAYSQDTIRGKFTEELGKLHEMLFFPLPPSGDYRSFSAVVTLYIQNDAPTVSLIVWEIDVRLDDLSGVFHMDDQTGKILSFAFSGSGYDNRAYTEDMVNAWASYLGAEIRNTRKSGDQESASGGGIESKYLFELYSGQRSVSGQMSSITQSLPERANRWSLQYIRLHDDGIVQ